MVSLLSWNANQGITGLGAAGPALVYSTGTNFPSKKVRFDAAADEVIHLTANAPQEYALDRSNVTCTLYWMATSSSTGDVAWFARLYGAGDGETYDGALSPVTKLAFVTDTSTGSTLILKTCTATFTDPPLYVGELLNVRVGRWGSSEQDTCACDAFLLAVELRTT